MIEHLVIWLIWKREWCWMSNSWHRMSLANQLVMFRTMGIIFVVVGSALLSWTITCSGDHWLCTFITDTTLYCSQTLSFLLPWMQAQLQIRTWNSVPSTGNKPHSQHSSSVNVMHNRQHFSLQLDNTSVHLKDVRTTLCVFEVDTILMYCHWPSVHFTDIWFEPSVFEVDTIHTVCITTRPVRQWQRVETHHWSHPIEIIY